MRANLERFLKAKATYSSAAVVQSHMQDKLIALLKQALADARPYPSAQNPKPHFNRALEFGCGVGDLTRKLLEHFSFAHLLCNDIHDYSTHLPLEAEFLRFDMENLDALRAHSMDRFSSEGFELIISNACLQWLDQPRFFKNITAFCKKDSLLALSCFGKQNLHELKALTHIGLDYLTLEDYRELLKEEWEIVELCEEEEILHFSTPLEALRHLKHTGVNSLSPHFPITKSLLEKYSERYQNTLTYHPIYLIAKRR